MIALDTNVLVRFVVADDRAQASQARALVARVIGEGGSLFVSDVVLCEFVWVLQAAYRFPRGTIAQTLARLLQTRSLSFRDTPALARAVDSFSAGKGDFADYVVLAHARATGCESVATFDHALLKEPGFCAP